MPTRREFMQASLLAAAGAPSAAHAAPAGRRGGTMLKGPIFNQDSTEFFYTHPMYTFQAIDSQQGLQRLNGRRNTFFCGSYFGYGFHEDAVRSAVQVADMFGVEL